MHHRTRICIWPIVMAVWLALLPTTGPANVVALTALTALSALKRLSRR